MKIKQMRSDRSNYGVKTGNNILDICKEKKWKPARNGMCVGKKMINYLKTV